MEEPKKLTRRIHYPKDYFEKRDLRSNYYDAVPQEGEPTEIDVGKAHCNNCNKEVMEIRMWVKEKKIEDSFWINVCKECKFPIGGVTVMEN